MITFDDINESWKSETVDFRIKILKRSLSALILGKMQSSFIILNNPMYFYFIGQTLLKYSGQKLQSDYNTKNKKIIQLFL